ncbi:MAG: hypothetical protein QOF58_2906 [Pseudonocardiales bacterium]|jgi:hypothetical protein|nr:hypothetical protein [Pseudonocardiales bacterium]
MVSPNWQAPPAKRLNTGWIVAIVVAAVVLVAGAVGTTVLLINKPDSGIYQTKNLPTCDKIAGRVKSLPQGEATANGNRCGFADPKTGTSTVFEISFGTIDEKRVEFQKHLDAGWVRVEGTTLGDDVVWTRGTGDGSFCSAFIRDSNATFKIDHRDPRLTDGTQGSVEPEWLCQTSVRLYYLDVYLLARGI